MILVDPILIDPALYTMPRALDSLYMLLVDRKWLAEIPNGDAYLGIVSLAGLMYFYKKESDTMAPLLRYIFDVIHPTPAPSKKGENGEALAEGSNRPVNGN